MKNHKIIKNTLISLTIFAPAIVVSVLFQKLDVQENISTIFVFAVFLISLLTERYIYGIVSAVAGMLAINYAFTYPYFALDFINPVNIISAVIMVTVAILTCMLTTRIDSRKIKITKSPTSLDELIDPVMTKSTASYPGQ